MVLSISWMLLILGLTYPVLGMHFRGGSFHWRPLIEPNKVEVTYSMGFNGFRVIEPGEFKTIGHDVCREIGTDNLRTIGNLIWDECVRGTPYDYGMLWHCKDLHVKGDWEVGGKSFIVEVPDDTKKAVVYYQVCCWVNPIQNVYPHRSLGWRMVTDIDLNPRRDNGQINSSPITSPIPLQLFHQGCKYWLEIPVTDPDNDPHRCRYTNASKGECYDGKRNTMCGDLDYVTIYPNCTLLFDTTGPPGYYAVRVMIEDLDSSGVPLSKVSLSFLLNVSADASTCDVPTIIEPERMCKTVRADEHFHIDVVARAATETLSIDRIESNKPTGMTMSGISDVEGHPLQKKATLSWTPTTDHLGRHNVGFRAVDVKQFSSGWSFITLNVVTGNEFYSIPELSDPSPGQTKTSLKKWAIMFNRQVQRPFKPTYITLTDESGEVASRIDASDPRQVKFVGKMIEFDVFLEVTIIEGIQSFHLHLDEGVAIDEEFGDCLLHSQEKQWIVYIESNEAAFTQAPVTKLAPQDIKEKCNDGLLNIAVAPSTKPGQECVVRPLVQSVTVQKGKGKGRGDDSESLKVPYEICCGPGCTSANCGL